MFRFRLAPSTSLIVSTLIPVSKWGGGQPEDLKIPTLRKWGLEGGESVIGNLRRDPIEQNHPI